MEITARPRHSSFNTCSVCEHTPSPFPHTWRSHSRCLRYGRAPGAGAETPSGGTALLEHRDIPPGPAAGHGHSPSPPLATVTGGSLHPAAPLGKNMNRLSRQRDKTRVSQHRRVNPPQQITLAPLGESHGNQSTPSVPSHCRLSALLCFP